MAETDPTLPDQWVPTVGWRKNKDAPGIYEDGPHPDIYPLRPVTWAKARLHQSSFMAGGHECVEGCRAYVSMEARRHRLYLRHGEELCEIDFDAPELVDASPMTVSNAIGSWLDGLHGYGPFRIRGVSL